MVRLGLAQARDPLVGVHLDKNHRHARRLTSLDGEDLDVGDSHRTSPY